MSWNKLTPEQTANIISYMILTGSLSQTAKLTKVSVPTIFRIITDAGFKKIWVAPADVKVIEAGRNKLKSEFKSNQYEQAKQG